MTTAHPASTTLEDPFPASSATSPPASAPSQPRQEISVAVDPVALITTECITVTSAMRKHARWAQSSVAAILGGGAGGSGGGGGYDDIVSAIPPPSPGRGVARSRRGGPGASATVEGKSSLASPDVGLANRWGLRGRKGKSIQV